MRFENFTFVYKFHMHFDSETVRLLSDLQYEPHFWARRLFWSKSLWCDAFKMATFIWDPALIKTFEIRQPSFETRIWKTSTLGFSKSSCLLSFYEGNVAIILSLKDHRKKQRELLIWKILHNSHENLCYIEIWKKLFSKLILGN